MKGRCFRALQSLAQPDVLHGVRHRQHRLCAQQIYLFAVGEEKNHIILQCWPGFKSAQRFKASPLRQCLIGLAPGPVGES